LSKPPFSGSIYQQKGSKPKVYYKSKRKKGKAKISFRRINPLKLRLAFNSRRVTKHGGMMDTAIWRLSSGSFGLDRLLSQKE